MKPLIYAYVLIGLMMFIGMMKTIPHQLERKVGWTASMIAALIVSAIWPVAIAMTFYNERKRL